MEEIVVTAQKREQVLGDVPLAISALTENTLEGANIKQVRLLTEATPKITHASNFGTFGSVFSGRGLSASTNFDPVISSYVDETAYGPMSWVLFKDLKSMLRSQAYFGGLERDELAPDGWAAQLYQSIDQGKITEKEAGRVIVGLALPSPDTTILVANNMLVELGCNPDQYKVRVRENSYMSYLRESIRG